MAGLAIMLAPQKGFNGYSLRRKASGKFPVIEYIGSPESDSSELFMDKNLFNLSL